MKMTILKIAVVLTVLVVLVSTILVGCAKSESNDNRFDMSAEYDINEVVNLEKGEGEFKILQLADTQIDGAKDLQEVKNVVDFLVEQSKPDLIVLTGDNVEQSEGAKNLKLFVEYLDGFNIPYAPVFGNHDKEGGTKEDLAEILLQGKNCLFKKGPNTIHGVGNYVINIVEKGDVKYSLYCMDSNDFRKYTKSEQKKNPLGGTHYDFIYQDQIDWYEWNVKGINANTNKKVSSLAFFHIPLPEYRHYKKGQEIIGEKIEEQCSPYTNSGFFSKMKELESTKGVFVGHDHINSYAFNYEGIVLAYGLKTGKTSYFNKDKDMSGGSTITFNKEMTSFKLGQLFYKY